MSKILSACVILVLILGCQNDKRSDTSNKEVVPHGKQQETIIQQEKKDNKTSQIEKNELSIESIFAQKGYMVEASIEEAVDEPGLYSIAITTSDYIDRPYAFMGECCTWTSVMIATSFKKRTEYLFMGFNKQVWAVKTKYCLEAYPEGIPSPGGVKTLMNHLSRIK